MSDYFKTRKGFMRFMKSDIQLRTKTLWGLDKVERIDGFYFMSKRPFSKSYQWHGTIGLENTYLILELIQKGIKNKSSSVQIVIRGGMGVERVYIWKSSFKKAEKLLFDMIKEIQNQY